MEQKHETKPTPASERLADGHATVRDAVDIAEGTDAKPAPDPKPAQTEKPEAAPNQTINVNVDTSDKKD